MSSISVKQIQLAGAGVIRSDLIKKTIRGKIYAATIYYKDSAVDVRILYYRSGDSKLLGPLDFTKDRIEEFERLLFSLIPALPHPDYKILRIIRIGLIISIAFTGLNIATVTADIYAYIAIAIDILTTGFITALYKTEGKRYVKKKK